MNRRRVHKVANLFVAAALVVHIKVHMAPVERSAVWRNHHHGRNVARAHERQPQRLNAVVNVRAACRLRHVQRL